ncbi:hypothetical protein NA57DRAFT_76478 [Rhizodiscina lignyota]|uniref:CENP-V/GFA domain-containing protein n=1 Tax=Rhizodiscina lignyota TaxID=1504668 RepID=A0A9P4IGB6_9PEZI|nr:hypothetical protein NA57DRAFT_76478 [Rhizodiscina lignyota]
MTSEQHSETYHGNCHCGAIVYQFKLSPPIPEYKINQCNCSVCTKNGYALVYPLRKDVEFTKGWDTMKSYQMARRVHHHRFCPECSASIMIDFDAETMKKGGHPDAVAMNVRQLKGIDMNNNTLNGWIEDQWRAHRRARRWRYARNIFFFTLAFGSASFFLRPLPEDLMIEALNHELDEHLPIVQKLRLDAATKPLQQCFQEIDLTRSPSSTLTEETLTGSHLLGPQRAFWSSGQRELILIAWFGWKLNGWPSVAHGGAIATVMSDAMSRAVGCMHPSNGDLPHPDSISITYLKPTRVRDFYLIRVRPLPPSSQILPGPSLPPSDSTLDREAHDIAPHKDLTKQPLPSEPLPGSKEVLEVEASLSTMDGRVLVKSRAAFKAFGS